MLTGVHWFAIQSIHFLHTIYWSLARSRRPHFHIVITMYRRWIRYVCLALLPYSHHGFLRKHAFSAIRHIFTAFISWRSGRLLQMAKPNAPLTMSQLNGGEKLKQVLEQRTKHDASARHNVDSVDLTSQRSWDFIVTISHRITVTACSTPMTHTSDAHFLCREFEFWRFKWKKKQFSFDAINSLNASVRRRTTVKTKKSCNNNNNHSYRVIIGRNSICVWWLFCREVNEAPN